MPGTGISIIRRVMEIRNRVLSVLQKVRNGIVQHRKTWLPYIGILVCLGAIWIWWDEPSQGQEQMKRDAAQHEAGSHPVFSASDEAERKDGKGDLVYDVRPALRYKPLPDLFAGSLPKKTAAPEAVQPPVPAAVPEEAKEKPKKEKKEWMLPVVCGAVHEGDNHLVILKWQGQTATCAAGERWNGWYIAYVNRQAAGLQRDGRVFEIPL